MENNIKPGCIIELIGDEFLDTFIKEEDVMDYQYLLFSTDITSVKKFKNVMEFPNIIPSGYVLEYFMSKEMKQFKHEYENFLMRDEIRAFITAMVKSVVYNGFKLVILCSEEENEYKYLKMIRKFIEKEYNMPTYTYKKYAKARDKGELPEIENLDKIKKKIEDELKRIDKLNINVGGGEKDKMSKAKKALEKMSRKELKEFCKQKGYKKKKYQDLDKEELRKFIIKKIEKEVAN